MTVILRLNHENKSICLLWSRKSQTAFKYSSFVCDKFTFLYIMLNAASLGYKAFLFLIKSQAEREKKTDKDKKKKC